MTAEEVEALLSAGEVWRLAQMRATALAHAVRADPAPLLDALEADGFAHEAAQVREALAGRLTEEQEEVNRFLRDMRYHLHHFFAHEPSWMVAMVYDRHPELRGALDHCTSAIPQLAAALDSWRAGHAVDAALAREGITRS